MAFEIVLLPAMLLVGSELKTVLKDNQCYADIPPFWQQIRQDNRLAAINNKLAPDVILGVYTNYSPDFSLATATGGYSLIVGCPVTAADVPAGMVVKEIPAAKYAVFTATGRFYPAIFNAWMQVWQEQGIERTFTADFEWYDAKSTDDESSVVNIYIAIK